MIKIPFTYMYLAFNTPVSEDIFATRWIKNSPVKRKQNKNGYYGLNFLRNNEN